MPDLSIHTLDVAGKSRRALFLTPRRPVASVLFLYGGGGSADTLEGSAPLWRAWMEDGTLPSVAVAAVDVAPFGFYLDGPDGLDQTAIRRALPAALRAHTALPGPPALFGISMGGHAALAAVLDEPWAWGPTVAMQPMVEPGWHPEDSPAACRSHYPPGIPEAYLGTQRTEWAWRRHHPAHIATRSPGGLPPLLLEAAAQDEFGAQHGARFVHDVLTERDMAHTWRLSEDARHTGPSVVPRLHEMAAWLGDELRRVAR